MTSGALDTFPQEILVRVLHNCDYVTIIRFSLTCKRAHEIVSSSVSLQLHVELDINGLEIADGSWKGNPDYSLALKELRDYVNAWFDLKFSPIVRQHIGDSNIEVPYWRIRSGTCYGNFRISQYEHGDSFRVYDSTQVTILGSSSIPPPIHYEKKFTYSRADPRQDLVVLVEDQKQGYGPIHFHLCSLATGKPHPLAEHPILTVSVDNAFLLENNLLGDPSSNDLRVMGNYVVAKLDWRDSRSDVSETLLWNWKTGKLLSRINADCMSSYSFLDKEHLVVYTTLPANNTQSTRFALLIYRIPSTASYEVPPHARFQPSLYPKHNPILVFEFPELHSSWEIIGFHWMMGYDPLPGDVVYAKSATLLCSHVMTLGLSFRIWNNPHSQSHTFGSRRGTGVDFDVLVSTRHLFAFVPGCQSEDMATRIIPWDQWGTPATRWFAKEDPNRHLVAGGYRSHLMQSAEMSSSKGQFVTIADFNTPVIMRHAYTSAITSSQQRPIHTRSAHRTQMVSVLEGKGLDSARLFQPRKGSAELPIPAVGQALNHEVFAEMIGSDMETIIRNGFKESVVSRLPYRAATKLQRMPLHDYWQIRGEYIIGAVS